MTDPYKILGVSSDASDDEIKTAYRTLAGKYQQEIQLQTPQAQWAEQKMKELDEAYDFIIASRRSQKPPVNNSYYQSSTDDYHDIRMKISSGRIEDAEVILDGIPEMQRNAEWHFLKGTVQYKREFGSKKLITVFRLPAIWIRQIKNIKRRLTVLNSSVPAATVR